MVGKNNNKFDMKKKIEEKKDFKNIEMHLGVILKWHTLSEGDSTAYKY